MKETLGRARQDGARAGRNSRIPSRLQVVGVMSDLCKHRLPADAVESIGKIQEEAHTLIWVISG